MPGGGSWPATLSSASLRLATVQTTPQKGCSVTLRETKLNPTYNSMQAHTTVTPSCFNQLRERKTQLEQTRQ